MYIYCQWRLNCVETSIPSFFHASNIFMCYSFPGRPVYQKMSLQLMRKKQEKNVSSYNGSGLSLLLDRSSTVSVQRKLGESINCPINVFNFLCDKKNVNVYAAMSNNHHPWYLPGIITCALTILEDFSRNSRILQDNMRLCYACFLFLIW